MNYRFSMLYVEATRVCNLRCPMCMAGRNDPKRVRASRRQELSYDEIRELVLVPAKSLGIRAVAWSGGESLLRKDALDLLRLTVELGLKCNVCTNCEALSREQLEAMKDATGGKLSIAVGSTRSAKTTSGAVTRRPTAPA